MMKVGQHSYLFNKEANGGESFSLTTEFHHNGNDDIDSVYTNQEVTLHSYGNSASFHLHNAAITPTMLRELADELDAAAIKAANNPKLLKVGDEIKFTSIPEEWQGEHGYESDIKFMKKLIARRSPCRIASKSYQGYPTIYFRRGGYMAGWIINFSTGWRKVQKKDPS